MFYSCQCKKWESKCKLQELSFKTGGVIKLLSTVYSVCVSIYLYYHIWPEDHTQTHGEVRTSVKKSLTMLQSP